MKKYVIYLLFTLLIFGNVYTFVSGIQLSNDISFFEEEINNYHLKNIELEKKAFSYDSFQYAASLAARLKFSEKATPVYLDNLSLAFNKN